jgi:DNA repair exonuclease SbcCD nuclease subunit
MKLIAIGDPHIKIDNIPETELFIQRLCALIKTEQPDAVVVLGDLLHTHERVHTTPLNKAYDMILALRELCERVYILVGNHDYKNNQQFLTDNHWMNGMKEWDGVTVVDKVVHDTVAGVHIVLVPYVPPGRFQEALHTGPSFLNAGIIFAHQEFSGCKMGAIVSIEGDVWPKDYPQVVSGHIHSNQTIGTNVYYPGSSMQHAFGESEKNIIPVIEIDPSMYTKTYTLREIDLDLPRKKIVYMGTEDLCTYDHHGGDKVKVTISGSYEEFKALRKTKKYRDLENEGVKIVFKPKKIIQNDDEVLDESVSNFGDVLLWKVNNEKNPHLVQAYELVVNNKEIQAEEIMFI